MCCIQFPDRYTTIFECFASQRIRCFHPFGVFSKVVDGLLYKYGWQHWRTELRTSYGSVDMWLNPPNNHPIIIISYALLIKSNAVVVGVFCLSPPSTISFEKTGGSGRGIRNGCIYRWSRCYGKESPMMRCMGFDMIHDRMSIIITYSSVVFWDFLFSFFLESYHSTFLRS
jgi:hypothetical protein